MGFKAKDRLNQVVHQRKRQAVLVGSFSCPDGLSTYSHVLKKDLLAFLPPNVCSNASYWCIGETLVLTVFLSHCPLSLGGRYNYISSILNCGFGNALVVKLSIKHAKDNT